MVTFDREGLVRSWNASAERVFGWSAEEVIGRDAPMGPEDVRRAMLQVCEQVLPPEGVPALEVSAQKKDGSRIDLFFSPAPLKDVTGDVVGLMAVYLDVTARRQAEDDLRHQASHDNLTDLPNRLLLHGRLESALETARGTGQSISLLLLDLDRFKDVNDTLGHHVGDLLLRQVATRLQHAIGATETIARLGGDEFAIVLPAADAPAASTVARFVLTTLEAPFQIGQHVLHLGGSIGVAVYPEHGTNTLTLLQHADVAMYAAKRAQSGVVCYEPVRDQHTVRRLALMHDLRRSIRDDELSLHYQPKVSLATGQVCGVEALLRWLHPVHGFIPPAEFIPLAEQTGMVMSLTEWVLLTALQQARAWQDAGQPIPIAINLSARSLQDQQFPHLVARHIKRYGVAPANLVLEITETSLMTDPTRAHEALTGLHALGVRMAIDDFGTGYSSLAYLKELPVDEVKIDKSFVLGMGAGDQKDAAIVRSVIALAHALGLVVVAEGVEDAATFAMLEGLDCDIAQGYYLSRPKPIAGLEQWLGDYRREPHASLVV
jgi:diguanylate cyclase (GGDEF)-like protein/PAS domain S-box-containing protein